MEQSQAILLRKIPWSETSLIVTWLARDHGRVRTVVRGARRPKSGFCGMLDLFFQAEISFSSQARGDLHQLGEVRVTAPFDAARAGHVSYCLCAYFAELMDHAAPVTQAAPGLYDLLRRAVNHLGDKPASARALFHFERELCRLLGVHDEKGSVSSLEAMESLIGKIPASRKVALAVLESSLAPGRAVSR